MAGCGLIGEDDIDSGDDDEEEEEEENEIDAVLDLVRLYLDILCTYYKLGLKYSRLFLHCSLYLSGLLLVGQD